MRDLLFFVALFVFKKAECQKNQLTMQVFNGSRRDYGLLKHLYTNKTTENFLTTSPSAGKEEEFCSVMSKILYLS